MKLTDDNGRKSPVSQAFNQHSFILFPIDKPQGKIVPLSVFTIATNSIECEYKSAAIPNLYWADEDYTSN